VSAPLRIAVAGGGFAAAELVLALRALAEERVAIELISPDPSLPFKPAAPAGAVSEYDLAALAEDAGATVRRDAIEAVAADAHRVRLASGGVAEYDALVLAVGARPRTAVPGALTFRDQRDRPRVEQALAHAGHVAFVAPAGVTWTLPLYELALLAGNPDVTIVSPELAPLDVFGAAVGAELATLLAERGIHFLGSTTPRSVSRSGLELAYGGTLHADAVIAVPRLVGRRISGVPGDWNGFVATDERGRVEGLTDVFAAGDMTAFPVKQGGLATQQADVIASVLARRAGADIADPPVRHTLRTRLLGGDRPIYLHAELDGTGRALSGGVAGEAPWWPPAKLFGRHLTPHLALQNAG
jgi:sulfide:quinone oxidoreductase